MSVYRQINRYNGILSTVDTCPCLFHDCDLAKDSSIHCLYLGAFFQGKEDKVHHSEIRRTYSSMLLALISWKIGTEECPLDT